MRGKRPEQHLLARAGVGLAQVQRLMRLNDTQLTSTAYTYLDFIDGGAAINKLPDLAKVMLHPTRHSVTALDVKMDRLVARLMGISRKAIAKKSAF